MNAVFKFVLILVLILITVSIPVSGEDEARAIVVDDLNEATKITNPRLSSSDKITLMKGHSQMDVPIRKIKEINFNKNNGSQDMELITIDGKIFNATDNAQTNLIKYNAFHLFGDSDFGSFSISSHDLKKVIFYHPNLYNFVLESCQVQNTRAPLEDYDYASICVSVNQTQVENLPKKTKIMGDTKSGFHTIDLKLGPIPIFPDPNTSVVVAIGIVNA